MSIHENPIKRLARRLVRERKARREAERLLAVYSDQLTQLNEKLVLLNTQLELKVKARTTELRLAHDKALEASQTKSEFLATMSHEIRTPMNGVLGMLRLLRKTSLDTQQKRFTETALTSGEQLLHIINDILDFSKIEAGKMRLENTPFPLQPLIEDIAALFSPAAQKKGIALVVSLEPPLPLRVVGDPTRLRQVLSNLISNAIKFTESGHVVLHVTCLQPGTLHFSIVDTGIGLTEAQQSIIFEAFTQADSSHTRQYGGTGLGLAICRRLVEAMGGQLNVVSAPRVGSEFSFELPLEAVEDEPLPSAPATSLRVLIVDGYWANHVAYNNILHKLQIAHIAAATTGQEALQELRNAAALYTPFDVVILDALLPDMGGPALIQMLRDEPALKNTRTVLLYGFGESIDDCDTNFCFAKPLRESDLSLCLQMDANPAEAPPRPARALTNTEDCFDGKRLLLVEDNEVNQMIAQELLSTQKCRVEVESSGAAAITAVKRSSYDLILMDIQMPGMDGLETSRRIRALGGACATVPIIAMTAHAATEIMEECLRAGMSGYLAKPIYPEALMAIVAKHLQYQYRLPPQETTAPAGKEEHPTLPGIDVEQALARVRGHWPVLRKILLSFYQPNRETQATLSHACREHDWPQVLMLTHTLKGSSANIGANELSRQASRIEKACREQDTGAIPAMLPALFDALQTVLGGLSTLENPDANHAIGTAFNNTNTTLMDKALLATRVEHLLAALNSDVGEALHLLDVLKTDCAGTPIGRELASAEDYLNRFDIEATCATLCDIVALLGKEDSRPVDN